MKKSTCIAVCIGVATICGCQSARRATGNVVKFAAVGLWNGLTNDDVALEYDSADSRWNVAEDDE